MNLRPTLISFALGAALLSSCGSTSTDISGTAAAPADPGETTDTADTADTGGSTEPAISAVIEDHDEEVDHEWDDSDVSTITLTGVSASAEGNGVSIDGSEVRITSAGTYEVNGTLDDGRIVIDTESDEIVRVILSDAHVTSSTTSPFVVDDASEVMIVLAEGTTNTLSDAAGYVFTDAATDEPNAALFSTTDLTIDGGGTLIVDGNFNDGISSKDGLVIAGGEIEVVAVDDGIRGKDYLIVEGGDLTVIAGGDGLKADNDDTELGTVTIADADIEITADGDAIVGNHVSVGSGDLDLQAGGGHTATLASDTSAKGIKSTITVTITGGTIDIDAADDAVHSNDTILINGGEITLASADDAIHADANVAIDAGTITVTDSYEGIESAIITINGGEIDLTSSDDGLNAAAGDSSSSAMGQPGTEPTGSSEYQMYINGGSISINSQGDGLDSNGSVLITDGVVVVYGPTTERNNALDVDGEFWLTGGTLIAGGSSGRMADSPDADSPQPSIVVTFDGALADSVFQVLADDGTEVAFYQSTKSVEHLVVSTPEIESGSSYEIVVDGTTVATVTAY